MSDVPEADAMKQRRSSAKTIDRRIAGLAIPALGALIVEPMFVAIDTAMIGHLGATSLAALAIAAAVLQTAVGLMIFLAYSTTPLVARRRGAGLMRDAVQAGVDGLWLALAIGVILAVGLWALSTSLIRAFGVEPDVESQALEYLTISCLSLPAMLVVYAAMGLLRGLQDTRTPLYVAGFGFTANALLNWWFIYGLNWGIGGSAWGTVVAQWGMIVCYLVVISRHTRAHGASPWPHREGLSQAGRNGGWLFIRTIGLRAALLVTLYAAASQGTFVTAGFQVMFTLFTIMAFALDALAIAAQALMGDALGASDAERARLITTRTIIWGVRSGLIAGVVLAATSPFLGRVFTSDTAVLDTLPIALIILGASLPLSGIVFVLDGVLMGAGDSRYLAWTSLVNLVCYLPMLWFATQFDTDARGTVIALTIAYAFGFMATRVFTLGLRARTTRWMRLGV